MEFIKKYFKHFCFAFIVLIGLSAVIFNPVSRLDANTDEGRVKFIGKNAVFMRKSANSRDI